MLKMKMLLLLFVLGVPPPALTSGIARSYSAVSDAFLCIGSEFVETHLGVNGVRQCAMLCSDNQRCQAYRSDNDSDGSPCQLYVFDACSRTVRSDCGCSQRGQLFVKQRSGLPEGSLCPSSFGHGRCGVKYGAYNGSGNWWLSKQRCESYGDLTIMANGVDLAELTHLDQLRNESLSPLTSVWLSGHQQPGGGWSWAKCGLSIDSGLWAATEPNGGVYENATAVYHQHGLLLSDFADNSPSVNAVICQCVSPFD